jgi:hypothetical protein
LYNIIKIKGEGLPSPFIFLVISLGFVNLSWAQLGSKNWFHPNPNFITIEDSSSYINIYNDTHIGLINFNDSLNISENKQGFKLVNRTSNGLIKFVYNKHHSIVQMIETDYSTTNSNNYNEMLLGFKIKKGLITSDASVTKYSGINALSPSLLLSTNLRSNMIFSFGRSNKKIPLQFNLNYTDFSYSLNNIYTDHIIDQYRISLRGKNYRIEYAMGDDTWKINSSDSSLSKIDLEDGNNKTISLSGYISLKNNKKVNWSYTTINNYSKLRLLNNSNKRFFELNKYTNDNHIFSLNYLFHKSNYKFNIMFQNKLVDLYTSIRIWPSRINNDLNSFFNLVPRIINNSIGELKQNLVSIQIMSAKIVFLSPYMQIDWIKDRYDITIDTKSLSIFGFPIPDYSDNQKLNIIGKEAINILVGINIIKNKWSFGTSFSQHIPYKIDVIEIIVSEEKKEKEDIYGGGEFNFSIIRYLDQ